MDIWFATGNAHKRQELAAILSGHTVHIPADRGIAFDPEETGSTFLENAMIKARALYDLVRAPVIADDSGLAVDALGGRPGVFSARYAGIESGREAFHVISGKDLSASERNSLLLEEFRAVEHAAGGSLDRSARFICCMVLMVTPDCFYVAQETFDGKLIAEERGTGGFGYDPVLYLEEYGCTVAELSEEKKNELSHRGKAARRLMAILEAGETVRV